MDLALVAWVPHGADWTEEGVKSIGGRFISYWMPKKAAEELRAELARDTAGNPGDYVAVYKERT